MMISQQRGLFICGLLLAIHLMCGCMTVKDIEGIRACLSDVADAEMLAVNIKRWGLTEDLVEESANRYNHAIGKVHGFLVGIEADARLLSVVDVPLETYRDHEAHAALQLFMNEAPDPPFGVAEKLPLLSSHWITSFVEGVIAGIAETHWRSKERALGQLVVTLQRGYSTSFDGVDFAYLERKYGRKVRDRSR